MAKLLWTTQTPIFNTITTDQYPALVVDITGNTYLAFQTGGVTSGNTNTGLDDIVVVKFNTNGQVVWVTQQPTFNTTQGDNAPSIGVDSNGNTYVAYYTYSGVVSGASATGNSQDVVLFKLDPNGVNVWSVQPITINTNINNNYPAIKADALGNSYLAYMVDNYSYQTISVTKVDTNGIVTWTVNNNSFNTSSANLSYPDLGVDGSSNIYVAYGSSGVASGQTNTGSSDIVVFKLDTSGNTQWVRQQPSFNTDDNDSNPKIAVDSITGNVHVCYSTQGVASGGVNPNNYNTVIFKLDTNGQSVWTVQNQTFNANTTDNMANIATDGQGNTYLVYITGGIISGGVSSGSVADIAVFKLNSNGQTMWTIQQPTFNSPDGGNNPSIGADPSGNVYVSYYTTGTISGGTNTGDNDVALFKLCEQQLACFNHDTKILCVDKNLKDTWIPIQDIHTGMVVKTHLRGNRSVVMCGSKTIVNDPSRWKFSMWKTKSPVAPFESLVITGGHAIMEDTPVTDPSELVLQKKYWGDKKYILDGKYMVLAAVSKKFNQLQDHNQYTYYHLVLDSERRDKHVKN